MSAQPCEQSNPHALSLIFQAGITKPIVASQDIVDESGNKLWSRDQPVSHALHQRLLERKLQFPIESCLRAVDGVTVVDLLADAESMLNQQDGLLKHFKPWASALLQGIKSLPLHAVVQLLLTTRRSTDEQRYKHDIQTMLVSGAIRASSGANDYDLKLALLGGLLHDLGEMYISPAYVQTHGPMSMAGYRHLAVHPRVGELLLSRQTDYPAVLARGVGEHHERLNGTGYPSRSDHTSISSLGSCLAAAEAIVGLTTSHAPAPWTRASLAMRLFPGEFSVQAQSLTSQLEKWANERADEATTSKRDTPWTQAAQDLLTRIESGVVLSRQMARESSSAKVRSVSTLSFGLLQILHKAGHSLGLWGFSANLAGDASFELHAALQEITFRVNHVKCNACLSESSLSPKDEEELDKLWLCLTDQTTALEATTA